MNADEIQDLHFGEAPLAWRVNVKVNRSIKSYRYKHKGERCIILGNGPSLDMVDLSNIGCPTIGTNASWMVHESTYHCATDDWQFENYSAHRNINSWTNLFTANVDYDAFGVPNPKSCVRLTILDHGGEAAWSDDLTRGIYLCTTIMWYALQLAAWMGFVESGLIGFDLCAYGFNSKFYKHPKTSEPFFNEIADTQNRLMGWARKRLDGRMKITNLSPISRCDTLEKIRFEQWI